MKVAIRSEELEVLRGFLEEAWEHLEGIEDKVLELEENQDLDTVNSIFRPVHTIKGTAAFLGLNDIKELCHETETVLDQVRKGNLGVTPELIDTLLNAIDAISQMLRATESALEEADEGQEEVELQIEDVEFHSIVKELQALKDAPTDGQLEKDGEEEHGGDHDSGPDRAVEALSPEELQRITFPPGMKEQFLDEAEEHIERVESLLLELEEGKASLESINELFRSLHTLKGNAGVLLSTIEDEELRMRHPLFQFQEKTHAMEECVQKRRDRNELLSQDETNWLLNEVDSLRSLLEALEEGQEASLSGQRERASNGAAEGTDEIPDIDSLNVLSEAELEALINTLGQAMDAARKGVDEILIAEKRSTALAKVGRAFSMIIKIAQKLDEREVAEEAEKSFNVVDFMSQNEPEEHDAILLEGVKDGFVVFDVLISKLKEQLKRVQSPQKKDEAGEVGQSKGGVSGNAHKVPSTPQKSTPPKKTKEADAKKQVIKVPQERLDKLMNLVGELVVTKNNFSILSREVNVEYGLPQLAKKIKEFGDGVSRIVDELQATIMTVRMVPVGQVFSRFPRMVRDLSRKLDKKIRLVMSGEDTEMDKTIIEALGDPLVHIIRNSADHGLESPDERKAKGKPEEGTIWLRAYNKGQSVIIEIEDDGRGIDANKIKMKALEKGLISHDAIDHMSDKEAIMLIFKPGFSTAEKVSEVSGRGVGMDVVKTAVEKIGGSVDLDSVVGQGTKVRLQLPLTLAISKGLEVEAGGDRYYIPLDYVVETVKAPKDAIHCHRGSALVMIRDSLLEMSDLSEALGDRSHHGTQGEGLCVKRQTSHLDWHGTQKGAEEIPLVVLNLGHKKVALKVDAFYNESEFVLKSLGGALESLPGFAGATVTGEGRILLVLDPPKLLSYN